jgi:opacity protein-like surface antigen
MNMKLLVVFLSIFITSVYAADSFDRILITKTSKKSNLKYIKQKLDAINVRMFVQTIPSGYYVYTKKFTDRKLALVKLRTIKKKFPYAKIVTINNETDENQEQISESTDQTPINERKEFFINFGLGSANTEGSTNDAEASQLENSAMSYKLEAGYIYNDALFFSVAYLDTSSDDINIVNYYGSANYKINIIKDLDTHAGLLVGFSTLELKPYAESSASTTMLFGAQIALTYELGYDFNVFGSFDTFLLDHTISLPDVGSKIEFSQTNNFTFGVGYKF